MFYLDPEDRVTDELVARMQAALGTAVVRAQLLGSLAQTLSRMDGLPVFDREPAIEERTALGESLLTDAVVRVLRMSGYTHAGSGFVLEPALGAPLEELVRAAGLVPVNFASAVELEALPEVGGVLAHAIVAERLRAGPFASMKDFADRVDGIGGQIAHRLAHALTFRFPETELRVMPPEPDLAQAVALLVSVTPGATTDTRLDAALGHVAEAVAGEAPMAIPEVPHTVLPDAGRGELPAAAVESLVGSSYSGRVFELISGAASSIDVCMFHIALPSENHPTRELLDGPLHAHARGVTVRVLVDRDRPADPYGSTIINSPAREVLNRNAELCRFDDEAVLLHSKYLVLDRQAVVVGSHNWSAGSFFAFDDVSVIVHSPEYAADLTARFTALWDAAAGNQ